MRWWRRKPYLAWPLASLLAATPAWSQHTSPGVTGGAETPANLYWPGDFETHPFGGIYSSDIGLALSDAANHSPGGRRSWEVRPGYQHLELLVEGHKRYRLSFWARADEPLNVRLLVITPEAHDRSSGEKPKPREIAYEVPLQPSDDWQPYHLEFRTEAPYPGPRSSEILISCFTPTDRGAFIDDLRVEPLDPPQPDDRRLEPTATIVNGRFEDGSSGWTLTKGAQAASGTLAPAPTAAWDGMVLRLGTPENATAACDKAVQVMRGHALAGQRVRLSAKVGYSTRIRPSSPWAGVLFVLRNGADNEAPLLTPDPNPLWLPIGLSAPPGEPRLIAGDFAVPSSSTDLYLEIVVQPPAGDNLAIIDEVRLDILPPPDPAEPPP